MKSVNPGNLRYLASSFAVALLLAACGGREGPPAPTFGTKQMGVAGVNTYGNSVATDANGNVYVAGSTQGHLGADPLRGTTDLFFTRYDYTGIKYYTKQAGAPGADTHGNSVAIDASGNIYVSGYISGGLDGNTLAGTDDFFLTKYNDMGNRRYTTQMGAAGKFTRGYSTAIDANGNAYVAGYTNGGLDGNTLAGTTDFFLTKYDATGTKLYTVQMGVAATSTYGYSVAIDAIGNVYVAGTTFGGLASITLTGTSDFFLAKFDTAGNMIYTRQMGVPSADTSGSSVATDAAGNVYVTGYTTGGLDGNPLTGINDFFLTKFDSAGSRVYTRQMGVAGKITRGYSTATDANGNVYVAGYTDGGLDGNTLTGTSDLFLTKFDATGARLFTRQRGVAGKFTSVGSIAIDAHNYVYVAGSTDGGLDGNTLTGTTDFFLMKFDSNGTRL